MRKSLDEFTLMRMKGEKQDFFERSLAGDVYPSPRTNLPIFREPLSLKLTTSMQCVVNPF